jgi:hypothetical protein
MRCVKLAREFLTRIGMDEDGSVRLIHTHIFSRVGTCVLNNFDLHVLPRQNKYDDDS